MSTTQTVLDLDQVCINTMRTLAIDAIQQANSGHPGTPMGMSPTVYCLWQRLLKFDPEDPTSGSEHIARGGTYRSRPPFLRSSIRIGATVKEGAKGEGADRFGFRVEMDVE